MDTRRPRRLPGGFRGKTRTIALCVLCLSFAAAGCNARAFFQRGLDSIEQRITRKSDDIQKAFKATITNMAVEQEQYLKCREIVNAWRAAQNGYYKDFNTYAGKLSALRGDNAEKKFYLGNDIAESMSGVCYIIEMQAADANYRMLFEMDKMALVKQYEIRLSDPDLAGDRRAYLKMRIDQLRTATPCQVTATDQGLQAGGQCGFAGDATKENGFH